MFTRCPSQYPRLEGCRRFYSPRRQLHPHHGMVFHHRPRPPRGFRPATAGTSRLPGPRPTSSAHAPSRQTDSSATSHPSRPLAPQRHPRQPPQNTLPTEAVHAGSFSRWQPVPRRAKTSYGLRPVRLGCRPPSNGIASHQELWRPPDLASPVRANKVPREAL